MKKIYGFLFIALAAFVMPACTKTISEPVVIDETEWLNKDRAIVVASDFSCPYFVVETRYGYSVLRNWGGGAPYSGSILYGYFDRYGMNTYYVRSERRLMNASTQEMWLSYFQAVDIIEWECGTNY